MYRVRVVGKFFGFDIISRQLRITDSLRFLVKSVDDSRYNIVNNSLKILLRPNLTKIKW